MITIGLSGCPIFPYYPLAILLTLDYTKVTAEMERYPTAYPLHYLRLGSPVPPCAPTFSLELWEARKKLDR